MTEITNTAIDADLIPTPPKKQLISTERLLTFAVLIGLLLAWQATTTWGGVPEFVLPQPMSVLNWLIVGFSYPPTNPASLWYHLGITAYEAFLGFAIGTTLGIILGMTLARYRMAERVFYPFIVAFQSLPKIAIAPLLVVWFGFGLEPKIIIVVVLTFFPLLVNSITGYHSVDPDRINLARACNASGAQIFWKIILPSALPYIFAGLHMAVVLCFLGALVGEFVGAQAGLGMLLLQYNNNMQVAGVFAILIVLGVIGFALNMLMRALENYFCFWARRSAVAADGAK
ncbi:ABC transporter permease [Mesorhizobium sp. YR577]|uniref:ABC transporter permease n=1 Tax=Mesorhizobium sp. YR577 TaxID=1884373 RepID=UPI0008E9B950|nr:ABC transporter permease [Mesorhizobium sp. YR577]SFU22376.1 NitT/TauT family transport system permease protein [Mesorhizobium sp. YR577]